MFENYPKKKKKKKLKIVPFPIIYIRFGFLKQENCYQNKMISVKKSYFSNLLKYRKLLPAGKFWNIWMENLPKYENLCLNGKFFDF